MLELNQLYHMDCMEGMAQFPDKYFDIAICDPPYFSGPNKRRFYGREVNKLNIRRVDYPAIECWDVPQKEYFEETCRVSKHQIFWGCNYFDWRFPVGRIVWDKVNGSSSFSDCEIASCSIHDSVRLFRYMWNGMMQGKSVTEGHVMQGNKALNEKRIHPTQKPINLYRWLAREHIQPGWKVLDTHVGSASSLIAYHEHGCDFIGFEKDAEIYQLASERLEAHRAQISLFEVVI